MSFAPNVGSRVGRGRSHRFNGFLGAKAIRLTNTASTNWTAGTTNLSFEAVEFDKGGWWTSASPTQFKVPPWFNGYVELTGYLQNAGTGSSGTVAQMFFDKNGVAINGDWLETTTLSENHVASTGPVRARPGDTFTLRPVQESDTSVVYTSNSYFSIKGTMG